MFGHPALRLLFWLKLRGGLRAQVRKLRRPTSWIFLILGVLLLFGWLALVFLERRVAPTGLLSDGVLRLGVQGALLVLLVLTLVGAFQFRGLYLPKEEIELSFSAPVERSALVRYRLGTNLFRSFFAALFFGVLTARRMPVPAFAFAGTFLVMMTMPVVGQGTALLLGASENRLGRLFAKAPLRVISGVAGAAFGLVVVALLFADRPGIAEELGHEAGFAARLAQNPFLQIVLFPLAPWVNAITATSVAQFLPWFATCVGAWILLHELVVRTRVDFRELSLATSAEVAKRIQLARRGGWAANRSAVSGTARTGGAPWWFGRGPFGAIAWLETTSMLRRARGTMLLSLLVVVLLVVVTRNLGMGRDLDPEESARRALLAGTALISVVGTTYLCAGLKFDFRGRLEHMDQVRAWPVAPWRVFLATILPEVVLVTVLLLVAIGGRAAWIGAWHPLLMAAVAFQPLFVLTWVALDNAVFLYAPIRYVPGQESALQNIGRAIVLVLLRGVVLLVGVGTAVLPGIGAGLLARHGLGATVEVAVATGAVVAWFGLVGVATALVWIGGRMLARFDVARDRGV